MCEKKLLSAESKVNELQARLNDAVNQRRHWEDGSHTHTYCLFSSSTYTYIAIVVVYIYMVVNAGCLMICLLYEMLIFTMPYAM